MLWGREEMGGVTLKSPASRVKRMRRFLTTERRMVVLTAAAQRRTIMKSPEPRVADMLLDEIDGYSRVVLLGECNSGLATRLRQRLDQLIRDGCPGLMLDTRAVRYLDNRC